MPSHIATGPDGNVWFTEWAGNRIGRITPAGVVAEYSLPPPAIDQSGSVKSGPQQIITGPDGTLWFIETTPANRVSKISSTGVITQVYGPGTWQPYGIAVGPDGNVWTTLYQGDLISVIGPQRLADYPLPGFGGRSSQRLFPNGITAGPDGNLWFTTGSGGIGKMTVTGALTTYGSPARPIYPIVSGPDGNLWFTGLSVGGVTSEPVVVKMTTGGQVTVYPATGATDSFGTSLTVGADGSLWFNDRSAIGTITSAGLVTLYPVPNAGRIGAVTSGPDGNLWFTMPDDNKVGRFTPPPTPQDFLPVAFFDFSPGP